MTPAGGRTPLAAASGGARAQSNLAALAVALVVVTAATVAGLVVADGALRGAERDPGQRRTAVALSERLVAADGPLTTRANVLDAAVVGRLNASRVAALFPVVGDRAFRVALDGDVVARRGDPAGGTTVRRVVLVERRRTVTLSPELSPRGTVTLPRRTPRVRIGIDPPPGTTVRTVRANGRVVLYNRSGLDGNFTVRVSRFETTTLRFVTGGPLGDGLRVTYFPARTTKRRLEVTVGER